MSIDINRLPRVVTSQRVLSRGGSLIFREGSTIHVPEDGKAFRTLNIMDEYSRECVIIKVQINLNSVDVIDALTDLFILRGVPKYIRTDKTAQSS